jgi:CheY-like chemotaxis protein
MGNFSGKTILIVDDSEINRQLVVGYLLGKDVNIIEADNGHEALNAINAQMPDLILLDLVMPDMDGFEFLEKVKTFGKKIPIIVLTAYLRDTTYNRCMEQGVDGYLNKPFRMTELLTLMNKVLSTN